MTTDASEPDRRREAVAALGGGLRRLTEAAVRSTAPTGELHALAEQVEKLAADLEAAGRRPVGSIPEFDDLRVGRRAYSPVTGDGHPGAPPVAMARAENGVKGTFTLGMAHEGPPRFAHGGVTALVLDELMGWAARTTGSPSMTVDLRFAYRGPVPLNAPLIAEAEVTERDGRSIRVRGRIAAEARPDETLVEADGRFVVPAPEQVSALFPGMEHLL
ncbi:PaaI family thioesterase [Glycomyces harbinensis]|uniref:Acyl-coenzyme A thioesterase THEM4 n=1 Tax=Glycomyces harbinensis TaxID=58114 RepID=A0A1G7BDN2_9ACTN|nr:PaaI family thioesterase [Glycomyces harbinensis]SDE25149.1 Acyl-coenzyme A thioesterase PaaI, contains HGG motif [Glycomyces harbinensis]